MTNRFYLCRASICFHYCLPCPFLGYVRFIGLAWEGVGSGCQMEEVLALAILELPIRVNILQTSHIRYNSTSSARVQKHEHKIKNEKLDVIPVVGKSL